LQENYLIRSSIDFQEKVTNYIPNKISSRWILLAVNCIFSYFNEYTCRDITLLYGNLYHTLKQLKHNHYNTEKRFSKLLNGILLQCQLLFPWHKQYVLFRRKLITCTLHFIIFQSFRTEYEFHSSRCDLRSYLLFPCLHSSCLKLLASCEKFCS